MNEMSDLYNSKIIADTSVEIFQVYAYYLKIIEEANRIRWISSLVSPGHMQTLISRVSDGIRVEMIVTPDVEVQLKEEPYASLLKQIEPHAAYHCYVTDDPLKFGIMVSDKHLLLGLFKEDMLTFDASSHFVSSDPQALSWGERLFTYFRNNSTDMCIR